MKLNFNENQSGFIALVTVLIIFVIALIVGLSLSLLSISEAITGLKKTQSSQAYFLANLCAEQALMKLKDTNGTYTGTGGWIDIENGSCIILVEDSWIVKVSSNFKDQIKKIKIEVSQVNPEMIIDSWQQVIEF